MGLPGYDAWKLATPPHYDEEDMTDASLTPAELAEMLSRYVELDHGIKPMVEERDEIKAALKAHIENTREPIVIEGWAASVREKNKPASVDLISAAQKETNDTHIVRAAGMGMLTANLTALRGQSGKVECADVLLGYLMPGGTTSEFRVERT